MVLPTGLVCGIERSGIQDSLALNGAIFARAFYSAESLLTPMALQLYQPHDGQLGKGFPFFGHGLEGLE